MYVTSPAQTVFGEIRAFFSALDLKLGASERAAMKARNTPAHGGIKVGADFRRLTKDAHAYRVLFVRTFLRLLSYEGAYVDRTTLGHPSRAVADRAGDTAASQAGG